MKYLLRHGILLDSTSGEENACDILIQDGIVQQVKKSIEPLPDMTVIELENAYISDGWVEAHTHIDWEYGRPCLDTNTTYASDGITYVVDAGTNGPANFSIIHDKIHRMPVKVKAYLNVAKNGSFEVIDDLDKKALYEAYKQYSEDIIGIKIRIDPRVNLDVLHTLKQSREIADELQLPLIVHLTRCIEPLEKILSYFKSNDVVAHTYSALSPCILDENGRVKGCVREARARGVWFDLSHGSNNFSFDVARKAMEQNFVVDTISSDLHTGNIAVNVRSLNETMSKMLYLGMPIKEIIRRVTITPAKMLGLSDKTFGISEGKKADITIFRVEEGIFKLTDSYHNEVTSEKRIAPILTIYGEKVFSPRHCVRMTTYEKRNE